MSRMKVTIEIDETAIHPINWDWVKLIGEGAIYISSQRPGEQEVRVCIDHNTSLSDCRCSYQ